MDVWHYFLERERECDELGLDYRELKPASDGRDDQSGLVVGRLSFGSRAYVDVFESVEVRGTGIHRRKYAYYLVIDNHEIGAYERDPTHDPAVHRHCSTERHHERFDDDQPISFKEAMLEAWEWVHKLTA